MADPSIRLFEIELVVTASSGVLQVYGCDLSASYPVSGRVTIAASGQYVGGNVSASYPIEGRSGAAISGFVGGSINAAYPVGGTIKEVA